MNKKPKYKWAIALYHVVGKERYYVGILSVDNTPTTIKNTGVVYTDLLNPKVKLFSRKSSTKPYVEALSEDPELIAVPFKFYEPTQGVV